MKTDSLNAQQDAKYNQNKPEREVFARYEVTVTAYGWRLYSNGELVSEAAWPGSHTGAHRRAFEALVTQANAIAEALHLLDGSLYPATHADNTERIHAFIARFDYAPENPDSNSTTTVADSKGSRPTTPKGEGE